MVPINLMLVQRFRRRQTIKIKDKKLAERKPFTIQSLVDQPLIDVKKSLDKMYLFTESVIFDPDTFSIFSKLV